MMQAGKRIAEEQSRLQLLVQWLKRVAFKFLSNCQCLQVQQLLYADAKSSQLLLHRIECELSKQFYNKGRSSQRAGGMQNCVLLEGLNQLTIKINNQKQHYRSQCERLTIAIARLTTENLLKQPSIEKLMQIKERELKAEWQKRLEVQRQKSRTEIQRIRQQLDSSLNQSNFKYSDQMKQLASAKAVKDSLMRQYEEANRIIESNRKLYEQRQSELSQANNSLFKQNKELVSANQLMKSRHQAQLQRLQTQISYLQEIAKFKSSQLQQQLQIVSQLNIVIEKLKNSQLQGSYSITNQATHEINSQLKDQKKIQIEASDSLIIKAIQQKNIKKNKQVQERPVEKQQTMYPQKNKIIQSIYSQIQNKKVFRQANIVMRSIAQKNQIHLNNQKQYSISFKGQPKSTDSKSQQTDNIFQAQTFYQKIQKSNSPNRLHSRQSDSQYPFHSQQSNSQYRFHSRQSNSPYRQPAKKMQSQKQKRNALALKNHHIKPVSKQSNKVHQFFTPKIQRKGRDSQLHNIYLLKYNTIRQQQLTHQDNQKVKPERNKTVQQYANYHCQLSKEEGNWTGPKRQLGQKLNVLRILAGWTTQKNKTEQVVFAIDKCKNVCDSFEWL